MDRIEKDGGNIEKNAFKFALAVLLICFAAIVAIIGFGSIRQPRYLYDIVGGIEQNVVFTIQKMLGGGPMYTDPARLQFDVSQYTPLYYLTCFGVAKVLGVGAGEVYKVYAVGRSVSLVAGLLWMLVAFMLMARLLNLRGAVAATGAAFVYIVCSPSVFEARPDCLCSLFSLCAAYCFASGLKGDGKSSFPVAAIAGFSLFSVAAILTKQNAVQIPVACGLFLLLERRWKQFFAAVLWAGLPMLAAVAVMYSIYGGNLAKNVIDGVNNGFSIRWFFSTVSEFVLAKGIIAAAAVAAFYIFSGSRNRPLERFFAFAAVFLLATAVLSAFKVGSGVSYFNDFQAFGIIAIACLAGAAADKSKQLSVESAPAWSGLVVLFFTLAFIPVWSAGQIVMYKHLISSGKITYAQNMRAVEFMKGELDAHPKAYFFSWDSFINLHFPDRCAIPQREIAMLYPARDKDAYYGDFARAVADGTIKYVISSRVPPTPPFLGARFDHFRLVKTFGNISIFENSK